MTAPNELLLTTSRFRVERVPGATPGAPPREIVRHPGAVCILPLVGQRDVCLIRNHRVAVGRTLIELPAGTLEAGEDPRRTAERELTEETGFRAGRLELLCEFFLSPGILDERMHVFVDTQLREGSPQREPGEQISNWIVPFDEAVRLVADGTIQDAKTMVGLLVYDRFRRQP